MRYLAILGMVLMVGTVGCGKSDSLGPTFPITVSGNDNNIENCYVLLEQEDGSVTVSNVCSEGPPPPPEKCFSPGGNTPVDCDSGEPI